MAGRREQEPDLVSFVNTLGEGGDAGTFHAGPAHHQIEVTPSAVRSMKKIDNRDHPPFTEVPIFRRKVLTHPHHNP
jgi:hypothetical protein